MRRAPGRAPIGAARRLGNALGCERQKDDEKPRRRFSGRNLRGLFMPATSHIILRPARWTRLAAKLGEQLRESARLDAEIWADLKGLGYEI